MIGYFTEKQPAPSWLFRLLYPDRGDFVVVAGRWDSGGDGDGYGVRTESELPLGRGYGGDAGLRSDGAGGGGGGERGLLNKLTLW
jgi:hypothetical protein